ETPISIKDFSLKSGLKTSMILKKLLDNGYLYTINDYLNDETITLVGLEFGIDIKLKKATENIEEYLAKLESYIPPEPVIETKPPVVVIMGHVDHGKTTLLDKIRKTNVAQKEAGGITQHIGAYKVIHNNRHITFLDTPGHEAFTALRARGAFITDIAVLVVAADDGVMPQTLEAFNHARDAKLPIIFAINKIDKKEANPHKVKLQLSKYGIIPEEWGGDAIFVELSALTGTNIDKLLEAILLQSDILNKKVVVNKPAVGFVIESKMSPSLGPEATLIIQQGILKKGDTILCGSSYGKVRMIYNDSGRQLDCARPSDPVRVIGLSALPKAGEKFYVIESINKAKEIAEKLTSYEKAKTLSMKPHTSLKEIYKKIEEQKIKTLKIILKTDVLGSMEVIKYSLENMKFKEVSIQVIHSGVGLVSESDILLADASDAIVLCFNVGIEERAHHLAKERGIEVRFYNVIYEMLDDVKKALEGLLAPKFEEVFIGKLTVKAVFKISRYGTVAGCEVKNGKVTNKSKLKVFRNGSIIFEGEIESLKRFKDDVREVEQGLECGVKIKNFDDIQIADEIEAYELRQVKQKLE
ncbi:MAG: translation initiation factor IF-2, partial [Planctomycetota bacterium]